MQPDLTGQQFDYWQVLNYAGKSHWLCKCRCGVEKLVFARSLRIGRSKSCGCRPRVGPVKHGRSKQGVYFIWTNMLSRCRNPKVESYAYYGGRGVSVCEPWLDFRNFEKDMGERPPRYTLDRVDPEGNYEPGNCRWASWREQRLNQRRMK